MARRSRFFATGLVAILASATITTLTHLRALYFAETHTMLHCQSCHSHIMVYFAMVYVVHARISHPSTRLYERALLAGTTSHLFAVGRDCASAEKANDDLPQKAHFQVALVASLLTPARSAHELAYAC